MVVVVSAVIALRSPRGRAFLERAAAWLLRLLQRIVRRPRGAPGVVVRGATERISGVHLSLAGAFWLVRTGGQGRGRTADLPLFRITDHRTGPAMKVHLPAQRPAVHADGRR
jgi:hypothetical protein